MFPPPPPITKMVAYDLVESKTPSGLSEKVNRLINEGYEVYGYPMVIVHPSDMNYHHYQAMVKYGRAE